MNPILKTKDYSIFKTRNDNRRIYRRHVNNLERSMGNNDLLESQPILCNEYMEVIDGQHRLLAAKSLGHPVYYRVIEGLGANDLLALNTNSLKWTLTDILEHYVALGYPEYIKIKKFITQNEVTVSTALNACIGRGHDLRRLFKEGKFVMDEELHNKNFQILSETISIVRSLRGNSNPFKTTRFSKAFMKMAQDPDFNENRWLKNLKRLVYRFTPCSSEKEYEEMIMNIYNYRTRKKIDGNDDNSYNQSHNVG